MREFIVGRGTSARWIRAVVGGKISSGKTHFAATFPRPLFLSDAHEGGAATLLSMNRELWWDATVEPVVWEIENMMEMPKSVTRLLEMAQAGKLPFQTIICDSLSIYAERVLRELNAANPGQDKRQQYGMLFEGLRALVPRMHSLPAHIIWLCHVDDEMQLTVPGRASAALWAYMSYKWMTCVSTSPQPNTPAEYQLHIRPWLRADWLGGRSHINAPSPMIPSFKPLSELLGFDERPPSPACPRFGGQEFPDGASYL